MFSILRKLLLFAALTLGLGYAVTGGMTLMNQPNTPEVYLGLGLIITSVVFYLGALWNFYVKRLFSSLP